MHNYYHRDVHAWVLGIHTYQFLKHEVATFKLFPHFSQHTSAPERMTVDPCHVGEREKRDAIAI